MMEQYIQKQLIGLNIDPTETNAEILKEVSTLWQNEYLPRISSTSQELINQNKFGANPRRTNAILNIAGRVAREFALQYGNPNFSDWQLGVIFAEAQNRDDLMQERTLQAQALQQGLEITAQEYSRLLEQAEYAFEVFTKYGPAYGTGKVGETAPTWRVAAEAIKVDEEIKSKLKKAGKPILQVFQTLPELQTIYPEKLAASLPANWNTVPFLFRIDAIWGEAGDLIINEFQIDNGASAVMDNEMAAYYGGVPEDYTAKRVVEQLIARFGENPQQIIWVYDFEENETYLANYQRFAEEIVRASAGGINVELVSCNKYARDWRNYNDVTGVIDYSFRLDKKIISEAETAGTQFLSPSPRGPFSSKELFSLLFDPELQEFWQERIENFEDLLDIIPETYFIEDLKNIKLDGDWVYKVAAVDDGYEEYLSGGKGVTGPWDEYSNLEYFSKLATAGKIQLIKQRYIKPKTLEILVKKGKGSLEKFKGGNRICVAYVPNGALTDVSTTAMEITMSEKEPVKGTRRCVMAAVADL